MTAPKAMCGACGMELPSTAKFCLECGAAISSVAKSAEYKQVTVLFADVVRSMDIAAAVGAERLREVMAELVNCSSTVVLRYGGTVDKFTGDGIMAVFGAPIALEDHASRACRAALAIHEESTGLAANVDRIDGVSLQLRIGLNSGEVIAGDIGSGALGYTAIGEQVGMAQRMESVAPPGAVMLSESTARLVDGTAELGEPELVRIKGGSDPVIARRLLSVSKTPGRIGPYRSALVGREWELAAVTAMLDRSITGHGCVARLVGAPGIGKSRIIAEILTVAAGLGVQVFSTFCESHTSEVPFHASTPLLRAALRVDDLDDLAARASVRAEVPGADPGDLLLLEDALRIRDPAVELPDIAPDARRRRLTALVKTIALTRATPAVYVIEDVHWIDATSESLFADILSVIPQTHILVLITYRPEYHGPLTRMPRAQTISLAPLDDSDGTALVMELLGPDPSVTRLIGQIAERAAGNPFFAEEIVRDLVDRGVLAGERGGYGCPQASIDVTVPATLHAAIAARVDRLANTAKLTLNAAAVIGLRFADYLLSTLTEKPAVAELIEAELIDQVKFTPQAEYVFRHPLIRTVAYRSQLKSDRADLHRRVAAAVQQDRPGSVDENAPLIAEHLQAAGNLHEAHGWLMRAGTWLTFRDIKAARLSWQRARDIADQLSADDAQCLAMRIAPRALLAISAFRASGSVGDTGFDELRELATVAGDNVSLAIGMAGQVSSLVVSGHYRESTKLATEFVRLVESINDPELTVSLAFAPLTAKLQAGELAEVLRLAQRIIELAEGNPLKGNVIVESPLAIAELLSAAARVGRGHPGWRDDLERAIATCRRFAPIAFPIMLLYKYSCIPNRTMLVDEVVLRQSAEAFELAQRFGDDFTLECARALRGFSLVQQDGPERADGFTMLEEARKAALEERSTKILVPLIDLEIAKERARTGDRDSAIELLRSVVDGEANEGEFAFRAAVVGALVEALLQRGTDSDKREARSAIEQLANAPTEPGFLVYEAHLLRMRALLARAQGDEMQYRNFAERYRTLSATSQFEGHMALADAMT